ncbi:MAG: glucoamylase [Sphingomonadales bacterium 63-6]|nr:MAG: glucoamylase [Sphingomonadales bacterium 63-6]
MQPDLNLWPIGNCQVSALIDSSGRYVWACVPRVDGEPLFSALLDGDDPQKGFWDISLEGVVKTETAYLRNTPVLITRHEDEAGNAIEVIDFCPDYRQRVGPYRPVAFARIVRPLHGSPRIRVRVRPVTGWSEPVRAKRGVGNYLRFRTGDVSLRLTMSAPVGIVQEERAFRLESPAYFFLGPDEPFLREIGNAMEGMLESTVLHWQSWVRGLAIPLEWQSAVIRAAITLKLCQHAETGAIVAALTTSIPEHHGSQRNWDYRFCWIRDAYYTVQALNRLGALDVLESYLAFLRNIVDAARGGHIQPLYGVLGEPDLEERIVPDLAGYRGFGPVREGNQAARQIQHDAYGQIVLSSAQAFFDERLFRPAGEEDFLALERVGQRAWENYDQPDAGLWELRNSKWVHTYSSVMCWAACDRLANAAAALGKGDRARFWQKRANHIRAHIERAAWRPDSQCFSATFEGEQFDASMLQMLDLRFIRPDDSRFLTTLAALEKQLRRGSHMLRYASEDDFGLPQTAFNVCTFWLIEALHLTGRTEEARGLFEGILAQRTPSGLLSEDIDPKTGELWGNFPQTYSLVGIINCATLLSRPWSTIR